MRKNDKNNINNTNEQEISKQVENSMELLILYRSIYILKQKFSLFKERIQKIYSKFNSYKEEFKFQTNIKIYQINIKNFVEVTDEVLQDLNLLLIKYINPKDIFLSKILIEKKRDEMKLIIKEILNWLWNENNNGNNLIKNYNIKFFNKKIKPYLNQDIEYENFVYANNTKNDNKKEDVQINWSESEYKILTEYDRKGRVIHKYKTKLLEENEDIDDEVITELIQNINENKNNKNDNNNKLNKEMSININEENNYENNLNKSDSNNYIFIETLPLIIADFLQSHMNNAIVESEDELSKELKILFDNEIIKRMNEYKNVLKDKSSILDDIDNNVYANKEEKNQKELEAAMDEYKKVKENIDIYRGILKNKKKSGENVDYIEKMIEKLLAKEIWLEHRIKLLMEKNKNNDLNINIDIDYTNKNIRGDNYSKILGNTTSISEIDKTLNKSKKFNVEINNPNQNSKILNESNINIFKSVNINDKSNTLLSSNTNLTSFKSSPNINNAIKEIFIHYSQLHLNVKRTRLFSNLEEKKLHLDLHEFSKFCSDFNLPIKRQKLVEIFKKSVSNLQYMTFKEFNSSLISLANATHESKKNKLNENILHKKFELNSIILKEKQIKEEKKLKRLLYNDSNSDIGLSGEGKKNSKSRSPSGYGYRVNLKMEKKNIFNEISDNKIKYNKENKKSYQEIMNDFYNFLGLNNQQLYRSKMRQYNMSPITVNESSILKKENNRNISSDDKSLNRSKSFIELEKINAIKTERMKKELMEEEKMKNKLYKEKMKLFNINNQRLKMTVDRKSKKKTYLELMKEKNEEKSEIISMYKHQKDMLLNKLKEKELKKIQEKEKERKMKKYINNTISKEDSKEQFQFNEISEIKKEKEEDYEKKNDKNQIWWSKLENYNIEDLGMNDAEKELFISSELVTDEKNNLDNINNEIKNQMNKENNSSGNYLLENSLLKSNSKEEIENNNNNEINNNTAKVIQLPPINLNKVVSQKEKEVNNKNKSDAVFKTNPNKKIKVLNTIKTKNNKI